MMTNETNIATNNHGGIKKSPSSKKKGTRALHVIKVAMHMLRRKRSEKKKTESNLSPLPLPLSTATNDALTRLVGSVRPLHLQGSMVSPPPPPPLLLPPPSPEWGSEQLMSPGGRSEASFYSVFPSSSSSGDGTISRYGSVQSLYELGLTDEDEYVSNDEADAYYDGFEGDELIDSKAEIFIAQFYKSVKKA